MCANCNKDYPLETWVKELKAGNCLSKCSDCGEPIKPRNYFLNSAVSKEVIKKFEAISADCDLIIALDMNAYMAPFCLPIDMASVPMVCISEQNPDRSGYDFKDPEKPSRLHIKSTANDEIEKLAKALNMDEELTSRY